MLKQTYIFVKDNNEFKKNKFFKICVIAFPVFSNCSFLQINIRNEYVLYINNRILQNCNICAKHIFDSIIKIIPLLKKFNY